MKLNYIDIHSHLNLSPLYENHDEILQCMREQGIGTITVGTSLQTSQRAVDIAEQYPELCSATVGIHPCDCEIPSPTLPEGKGDAPGYFMVNSKDIRELIIKSKQMKDNPTPAEEILWKYLKGGKLNTHFRRQHIIDHFIVDFVCLKKRLIIEVDGDVHDFQKERDIERTKILESLGFSISRFTNDQVINNTQNIIDEIQATLAQKVLPFGEDLGGDFIHDWNQICTLAEHSSVVAIGETGLDYFHNDTPEMREVQTAVFKKHIQLAVSVNKPLMLHVRSSRGSDDVYYDALDILREQSYTGKANFHFFSGSMECMQTIISAGYTVSVDGPITFVSDYDDMIKQCPIESIMVETDAPYAAPKPYRGKTCDPTMVIHVAERIAELKNLPLETVRLQLLENTKKFFRI